MDWRIRSGISGETHRARTTVDRNNVQALCRVMRPGDIVVKWSDNGVGNRLIEAYQSRLGYPKNACCATHVSLYVGDEHVVHAVYAPMDPRNSQVRRQAFAEYYHGQTVSVVTAFEPTLSDTYRAQVVAEAQSLVGQYYAIRVIALGLLGGVPARVLEQVSGRSPRERIEAELRHGQVCSSAVFEIFLRSLGQMTPLIRDGVMSHGPFVLPSDFFLNPRLKDIAPKLP